ncbi:hypothetical protein [Thermofilum pendens]|uniref:Uncharacterized protein n=1 Tax=Thermofilum pendens (strain DSM 2475 / Hrk 5) TaxID=368408 RepID=A1RXG0_THEPD|nr:hypothetical protein [Thermofilum pendens]ABL77890.1 hypothetical protein Tpen_0481 [Thermofilum pendens Hrk 5]
MVEEYMKGDGAVTGEGVEEFDEGFIREKLKELLRKAIFHRFNYSGLEATCTRVMWELINLKAEYQRYGEVYVELTNKAEVGVEKACRIAKRVFREALEHFEELKVRRTGKATWKVKIPGEKCRIYVYRKPAGHWAVEIRLYIRVTKFIVPDTLRLPPELLVDAQTGWLYGDASYIASRKDVRMGTSQAWQVTSFPGFWPGKEVEVYIRSVVIHETHVSVVWTVRVKGVRNAPKEWRLRKEEKQSVILSEIKAANEGEIDIFRAVRIATYYAADGKYPGPNTAKRLLEFGVGNEPYWIRVEGAVRIAKLLHEEVPQLLAFMCSAGCKKARYLARLALVEPKRNLSPRYLEVAGVRMNLQLVGTKNYRTLIARVFITNNNEELLRGFPERAREEGLIVKKMKIDKKYYGYYAGLRELMSYADKHLEAYDILIDFVKGELEEMPLDHPARQSVERLLERLKKARERALRKHAGGENN